MGIYKLEALPHHGLFPIEGRAMEVHKTLWIHNDANLPAIRGDEIKDLVSGVWSSVEEFNHVAEAGAPSPTNPDAQRRPRNTAFAHFGAQWRPLPLESTVMVPEAVFGLVSRRPEASAACPE